MCFLLKDVKEDENPAELVRSPEKTRPLTLANTDAKILSDAFSVGLTRAAPETIDPIQRGGLLGEGFWTTLLILSGGGCVSGLRVAIGLGFCSLTFVLLSPLC